MTGAGLPGVDVPAAAGPAAALPGGALPGADLPGADVYGSEHSGPGAGRPLGTDPRDLSGLYVRHRHELAVLAHRYLRNPFDVDEVVQEAFLRLVLSMPELPTEAQAVAYARRTVTNLCLDRIRHDRRAPASTPLDDMPLEVPSEDAPLEDPILAAEDAAIVRAALAKLAPSQRRALVAWEVEEKTVPQIAAELGIEETAVKHVLHRARRTLRKLLVGSHVDPQVDLLDLPTGEVWSIAGRRAAHGAQRVGIFLLLLALPALAVFGLTRGSGDAGTRIAEPPVESGPGLLDPGTPVPSLSPAPSGSHGTPGPSSVPTRPGATTASGASGAPSDPQSGASTPTNAGADTEPGGPTHAQPRPTRPGPSASPTPRPTSTGASPGPSLLLSSVGIPVPQGFTVSGVLPAGTAGVLTLHTDTSVSEAGVSVDSQFAIVARDADGDVRIDLSVQAAPGSPLDFSVVPTLPVRGADLRFDPVEIDETKALVNARGDVLVDIVLGLSGAGQVVGPARGAGLDVSPEGVRVTAVLSPDYTHLLSARVVVSGAQETPQPTTIAPTPAETPSVLPSTGSPAPTSPAASPSSTSPSAGSPSATDPASASPSGPAPGSPALTPAPSPTGAGSESAAATATPTGAASLASSVSPAA